MKLLHLSRCIGQNDAPVVSPGHDLPRGGRRRENRGTGMGFDTLLTLARAEKNVAVVADDCRDFSQKSSRRDRAAGIDHDDVIAQRLGRFIHHGSGRAGEEALPDFVFLQLAADEDHSG